MAKAIPGTFSGVGESKIFAAEVADTDPRWETATLNGQPVPAHLVGSLPWEMTDQGYAEKNAGKQPVRVKLGRDERDNEIGRRADDLMRMAPEDSSMASHPLSDRARQYVGPGMTPRFLSKARIANDAGHTRGYEIVKDEQSNPVTFGNMVLGQIPNAEYVERRAKAAARSRHQLAEIQSEQKSNELKPV